MTKKIFAISTLLLVLVIGALFVYNFIFKKSASLSQKDTQPAKTTNEGKVNQTGTGGYYPSNASNPNHSSI